MELNALLLYTTAPLQYGISGRCIADESQSFDKQRLQTIHLKTTDILFYKEIIIVIDLCIVLALNCNQNCE